MERWKKIATATRVMLAAKPEKRLEYVQETLKEALGMERVEFFPVERPMEELKAPGRNKIPFFEYLALQRCPITVDLTDQDVLPPELADWKYPNLLFVPLIVRDFALGILTLASNTVREFSPEESSLVEALIPQIITLTDAEVLLKESTRQGSYQAVLQELDSLIVMGDRARALATTAELVQKTIGVERVLLFASNGQKPSIASAVGCPYANEGSLVSEPCVRLMEECKSKKTTLIFNAAAIARLGTPRPRCLERQAVVTPISSNGRYYGVIEIFNHAEDKDFTNHEIRLVEQLAGRLGVALANHELLDEVRQAGLHSIKSLAAALDAKDAYTHNHSSNVARYSFLIAQQLGLSPEFCDRLHLAGLIHDIGKIGVPDEVLNKVEKLTDAEFGKLRQHPLIGSRILEPFPHLADVAEMMVAHHEKLDGRGYPLGLKGEEIPIGARLLCVADSFDAMSSDRQYRTRRPILDVLTEMKRCAGTQFDPVIVQAFFQAYQNMGAVDLNLNPIPDAEAFRQLR